MAASQTVQTLHYKGQRHMRHVRHMGQYSAGKNNKYLAQNAHCNMRVYLICAIHIMYTSVLI